MSQQSTELERKLVERIQCEGPITFRDFMQAALYDPEHGYYNTIRPKIGREGDYYTSSNVHPAFGALLARAFAESWLGWEEALTIIEFGPGTGQLACDVLAALRDEHSAIFEKLTYILVESSPVMQSLQRDKLSDFDEHVRWSRLEEFERAPVIGLAFSNEFVDALPVHRARFIDSGLQELHVTIDCPPNSAHLELDWGEPSTSKLSEYIERIGATLSEGQIIEINLDALDWLARVAQMLHKGSLITIDYGDTSANLYSEDRRSGTLRSFYRHRLIDSPLKRIGEQDITASVNFTALIEYGRELRFFTESYERQTSFLIRMGLIERIAGRQPATQPAGDLQERLALKNLFVPGGISDNFRVLIQRKLDKHSVMKV